MKRNIHTVGRQVFEVNFSSQKKSHELQDKISAIFHNTLQEGMSDLFDRLVPENKLITIENLTIDIGPIRYESLDTELVRKVMEKLEREISLLVLRDNSAAEQDAPAHGTGEVGSSFRLLEYFLLRGSLPWWASAESGDTPLQAFEFLIKHSPEGLIKLIKRIGQQQNVRRRIVYQFPEDQLRKLIALLEPEQAEFIFDYHQQVAQVQQQQQLIKDEESEFKKVIWEFILAYLIIDRGSHFNRKEFVKSNLNRIATHFNVSFAALLNIFTSSLVQGADYLRQVDSLQAIILEIAIEGGANTEVAQAIAQPDDSATETPESSLELLRYFLSFGSLPWWSISIAESDLQQVLSVIVSKYPRSVEQLIRSTGQQAYSRKLLVKTFSEETLITILELVEPENAGFIIDYIAEVKVAHTKQPVFKAQTVDLVHAIWEFIFEYLLVDRGSEFNRQVFLQSNIHSLANRFNLSYRELLVFMVNNIVLSHHNSARHLSLFQDLTALHQMAVGEQSGYTNNQSLAQANQPQERLVQQMTLLNVLYYWIKTGHKPWWAGTYASASADSLLDQLTRNSSTDAIIFLKHAGLQLNTRKRLVYQVSFKTLLNLFGLLPQGSDVVRSSMSLLTLMRTSKTVRYAEQSISERVLLFSLWDTLISAAYKSFSQPAFTRSVIMNLSLWFQVPARRLIKSFRSDDHHEAGQMISEAYETLPEGRIPSQSYNNDLLEEWSANNSVEQVISVLLANKLQDGKPLVKALLVQEALLILDFFLLNNKLPEDFKMYSQWAALSFLKELVLLIDRESPEQLIHVFSSGKYRADSFLRVQELFAVKGTIAEASVNQVLTAQLEKNILLYIKQYGQLEIKGRSMLSIIDSYLNDPGSRATAEFFQQLLKYSPVALQLAYHYKNETIYKLIRTNSMRVGWGPQTDTFLPAFNLWTLAHLSDHLDRERLDLLFRTFNFMMIGGGLNVSSLSTYLGALFKFLFDQDYQLMLKLAALIRPALIQKQASDTEIRNAINEIDAELQPYLAFSEISAEVKQVMAEAEQALLIQLNPGLEEDRRLEKEMLDIDKEQLIPEEGPSKDTYSEHDKIYIHNSGLVLLHPFLSTYFNRLQMLDKSDFISTELRHRAAHLLQYLAFGTAINEEHELVLNKILCNIPIEEPIPSGIELTEHERSVSAELLNAVLVQWEKMKNSSAESFQASFIQREGALYKTDENWNLQVEPRGYDVLLQTLPWGMGMIKTPWMNEFIIVEWS